MEEHKLAGGTDYQVCPVVGGRTNADSVLFNWGNYTLNEYSF